MSCRLRMSSWDTNHASAAAGFFKIWFCYRSQSDSGPRIPRSTYTSSDISTPLTSQTDTRPKLYQTFHASQRLFSLATFSLLSQVLIYKNQTPCTSTLCQHVFPKFSTCAVRRRKCSFKKDFNNNSTDINKAFWWVGSIYMSSILYFP